MNNNLQDLKPARHNAIRVASLSLLLAVLYVAFGWLGLQLAVPPGYATTIWPASGIAVAGLLFFGGGLASGVFVGSFLLNAYVSGAVGADGLNAGALAIALAIASGSTLQALFAALVLRRIFGVPVALKKVADIVVFALLAGPVPAVIAASVGVSTLFVAGVLPQTAIVDNWLTWWTGDLVGIAVFLPLALFSPWRPWDVQWSGRSLAGLQTASLVALLIPVGVTFYAWKVSSEISFSRNQAAFAAIAEDSERALSYRIQSYTQGLDGMAGLIGASEHVTLQEWRAYVEVLDVEETLPGINGIGFIEQVTAGRLDDFARDALADGVEDLVIHPDTPAPANFIIRYIEPLAQNRQAVGLNIAFESNRYNAAARARDTGEPTITKRIFLVQDSEKNAGFLLLRPVYAANRLTGTVEQRQAAFRGWVYAPFISNRFMNNLTVSQGVGLNLSVYDGPKADPDQLIYSSTGVAEPDVDARFSVEKTLDEFGEQWTIVWTSTPGFEASVGTNEATLVLSGGLLLSALFGIYLQSFARRENAIRRIVEQKTREIAAREEQTSSIVDTAVVAILLFDAQGRVLTANKAAEQIFGYQGVGFNDTSIDQLLGQADGERGPHLLQKLTGRAPASGHQGALAARRLDGAELFVDLQLNSWKTETGESRYTAIVRDVSLHRQVTIALEEAEERWSTALKGANIGVFDIDLTTGTSIVSDTWWQMLGLQPDSDANPQVEWQSRVHEQDLPYIQKADQACLEGRAERSETEYRIKHTNGSWIWLRSDASVTARDSKGKALRLVGTQTDITDLKVAESAVRASEERFRSAIENAPIGMALLDLHGRWLKVNDALCKFIGYTHDELLQSDFRTLTHPDDLETDLALVNELIDGKIETYQLEKRYIHKDGHAIWGLLSVSIARDEDGNPAYFISQIQDITHRKEMDRLKSEFISSVSHELRTPLTSIRGSLGLIVGAMANDVPEKVMRLLNIAHKNSERLILLINDILDMEKLTAGKVRFEMKHENLGDEVRQIVEANQGYAEQFDVTYDLNLPDEPLVANIDQARFQQVLTNLLSNATKFSPQGGRVQVNLTRTGNTARISISDNGSGIPASFHGSIFEPFSQADGSATRQEGGTGLGLHISKQMVERMGGAIDYESVEGEGATFWVDLPLIDEGAAVKLVARDDFDGLRALHIEDDLDFSAFLSAALKDEMLLVNAPTLADGRKHLAAEFFDLVIIDIQLPDGDGLSVLDGIPPEWNKPVIVLTATEMVTPDPRVNLVIVKSKTPEEKIVEAIVTAAHEKRAQPA